MRGEEIKRRVLFAHYNLRLLGIIIELARFPILLSKVAQKVKQEGTKNLLVEAEAWGWVLEGRSLGAGLPFGLWVG